MQLTTIIIDDSKMQNLITTKMVKDHHQLDHIGSYTNSKEGLEAVNQLKPDVVILDVEMPELNGFDLLQNLDHECQVILYSTRSQFALDAFQYHQVKDYLTKPMKNMRFEKSIARVHQNYVQSNSNKYFIEVAQPSRTLPLAS